MIEFDKSLARFHFLIKTIRCKNALNQKLVDPKLSKYICCVGSLPSAGHTILDKVETFLQIIFGNYFLLLVKEFLVDKLSFVICNALKIGQLLFHVEYYH